MPGNPVVGGTVLRRAAIQSPDYVQGSAGWTINADGSAEFNDLVIRGTFDGTDFILSAAGFFVYSGTPAAGNLIFSVTPAATTADAFGNAVPSDGATSYTDNGPFWSAVTVGDGVISWFKAASEAGPWTSEAGIGFSWNNLTGGGLVLTAPAGISGSVAIPQSTPADYPLSHTGTDNNSGSTFVSGERAQMNNLWSVPINLIIDTLNALISDLQAAGILD